MPGNAIATRQRKHMARRSSTSRALAALAVVVMTTACLGSMPRDRRGSPLPLPRARDSFAGAAGFSEGSSLPDRTDAELAAEFDGMVASGARLLRIDVDWWLVQETPTAWNWGPIDRIVDAARARDLAVLGMIGYTPPWARPPGTTDKHPPSKPAEYASFARSAVRRYAPRGVRHWEIWNEPNIARFWQPAPDPAAYTALLRASYRAIKDADAGATVISGGLSPAPDAPDGARIAPVTFLRGVYAAGGRGYFDALGHHPSNYPYMPLKPERDHNDNAFRGVTPVLYDTMRIWATEMGAPTVGGMTPEYLAAYLTQAYTAWRSWPYTGPLFWYSYRDAWFDPRDREANFGLVRTDGVAKEPALAAYRKVVRR
jgi:polysaccharide biosynthesis protein PslG